MNCERCHCETSKKDLTMLIVDNDFHNYEAVYLCRSCYRDLRTFLKSSDKMYSPIINNIIGLGLHDERKVY